MHKQKQAFTLVELIVVITILAILGTIAIMAFSGYSKNARDSARISDIGNMKKSLELWILQSGTYPDPSSGTGITYSGSTVWLQGNFGNSVTSTVGKLDKKPVDPLYDTEYTYSVTQSKKEYQIGAVLEKDMASNVIVPQTYAATTGEAYVSGTYNGILTTVGTNPTYIIALPSIILSSIANAELKTISPNTLVYEGKSTLPASYANLGLTMTGSDFSFTPTVVWSGSSIDALNNQSQFQDLVTSLQTVYQSNEAFTSLPEYTSIVSEGDKSVGVMSFVKGLLETNTSKDLTNVTSVAINTSSCNLTLPACNGTTCTLEYNPTTSNQAWVNGTGSCSFSCSVGYGGADCTSPTDPYWNYVTFLMKFEGVDSGTTFTEVMGHTLEKIGSSTTVGVTDTDRKIFGNSSYATQGTSANYIRTTASTDAMAFNSTEDFTVELWSFPTVSCNGCQLVVTSNQAGGIQLGDDNWGRYYVSYEHFWAYPPLNQWSHIAITRTSGTFRVFVNGIMKIKQANTTTYPSGKLQIGWASGGSGDTGNIDNFRVTKGISRYNTGAVIGTQYFTPPTEDFPEA